MYLAEFATIAIAHLIAVASPGPDFAVVLRQSIRHGSRVGLWTALGVGSAILLHVSYCLMGVALILSQSEALFTAVKLLGAAYLAFLGAQSLRYFLKVRRSQEASAGQRVSTEACGAPGEAEVEADVSSTRGGAFRIGFLTNGLNPKATLFFLALFTVVISPTTPVLIQIGYGIYLALATFTWFSMLSIILGRAAVRVFFASMAHWIEGFMGLLLLALALRIVFA